jgi:hypothetical protein
VKRVDLTHKIAMICPVCFCWHFSQQLSSPRQCPTLVQAAGFECAKSFATRSLVKHDGPSKLQLKVTVKTPALVREVTVVPEETPLGFRVEESYNVFELERIDGHAMVSLTFG